MSIKKYEKPITIIYDEEKDICMPFIKSFMLTIEETNELIKELQEYTKYKTMINEHNTEREKEIQEYMENYSFFKDDTPKPILKQKGYVYIVKVSDWYKIGRTQNMTARIGEYTKLPEEPIIIICEMVDDCISTEKNLQEVFLNKRIRGEWFNLSDEDIKIAKEIIKKSF